MLSSQYLEIDLNKFKSQSFTKVKIDSSIAFFFS